jgi:hypothetical protein
LKLWSFYVDLEEAIGTVDSTKAIYDKILELRIANAQIIVNYAAFLEENRYFEESFKVTYLLEPRSMCTDVLQVYERGVELFTFPVSFEIWNIYLSKFIKRYVSHAISFPFEDLIQPDLRVERNLSAPVISLSKHWKNVLPNHANQYFFYMLN